VGSNGAFDLASSAASPFATWCSIQACRHCPRVLMSCSIFLPARLVAASVVTNLARPDRAVDDIATDDEAVCRAAATQRTVFGKSSSSCCGNVLRGEVVFALRAVDVQARSYKREQPALEWVCSITMGKWLKLATVVDEPCESARRRIAQGKARRRKRHLRRSGYFDCGVVRQASSLEGLFFD